ncbi:unnamed protein product [Bursaphelenchus xylophilus]|uniref:Trehalase n=1 Tax=Bursaphelenchus xylophilus TaxID=6326 RepID=A0A1I7RW82_BURXY|nr:trehalase [Bursaphelenchus xylophilus]CAD5214613.1 unnamed protein product [Bursaphelenchus xylophilus]CAG9095255.1 unnamed protein product [Bursaphelenchus xylophilus]
MVIQAFVNAESSNVQKAGIELAKKWLHNNFHTFSKANVMWEKYDVTGKEGAGDGGEYEVQAGFGWSNGVALDLITSLGSRIFEGKHRKIAYHPKAEAFVFHSDSSKSTQSVTLNVFLLCLGRLLY